jgi:hypothetical protein
MPQPVTGAAKDRGLFRQDSPRTACATPPSIASPVARANSPQCRSGALVNGTLRNFKPEIEQPAHRVAHGGGGETGHNRHVQTDVRVFGRAGSRAQDVPVWGLPGGYGKGNGTHPRPSLLSARALLPCRLGMAWHWACDAVRCPLLSARISAGTALRRRPHPVRLRAVAQPVPALSPPRLAAGARRGLAERRRACCDEPGDVWRVGLVAARHVQPGPPAMAERRPPAGRPAPQRRGQPCAPRSSTPLSWRKQNTNQGRRLDRARWRARAHGHCAGGEAARLHGRASFGPCGYGCGCKSVLARSCIRA